MDQEFIDLMNLLLLGTTTPPTPPRTVLNPDYAGDIIAHANVLNTRFGLVNKDTEFKGSAPCHLCLGVSSPVIGPVVFSSTYNGPKIVEDQKPFVFSVFGLNPFYNTKNNSICKEKYKAGNELDGYSAFYNSNSCGIDGVFPLVFNPLGKYYKNVLIVYLSLIHGKFFLFEKFKNKYKKPKDRADWLINKVVNCPIIVPEFIPFHSKRTGYISQQKLYKCGLNYYCYHKYLFNILDNRLCVNGFLLSNGQASSHTLTDYIGNSLTHPIPYYTANGVLSHTLAIWKDRIVIILNDFLGRSQGKNLRFKDQDQLKSLIRDVIAFCKSLNLELPKFPCLCYESEKSKALIEDRQFYTKDEDLFEELFPNIEDKSMQNPINSHIQNSQSQDKTHILNDNKLNENPKMEKEKKNKRMPGETTQTIEKFLDDTKGLRENDRVVIDTPNGPKHGTIKRIFDYPEKNQQEAKILCDDGTRLYRKEKDIERE